MCRVRPVLGVRFGVTVGGVVLAWAGIGLVAATRPAKARAATEQFFPAGTVGADIAVADDGRAFLVSRRTSGTVSPVRTRSAAPGASFGPERVLMRPRRTARLVGVGVAANGSGVIAVQSAGRTRRRVRVMSFSGRGVVGRLVTVSRGDAADFTGLDVARSGAAVVVWFRHGRTGRWRLEASVREPGAAAFGPAHPVSPFVRRPCCTSVSAAIGETGDAAVTWTSTSRPVVWAARRRAGHGFGKPQTLATNASDTPRAVVGAGGTAAVLYSVQRVPRRADDGLQLHRAVRGGAFGPAEHVNPGGGVTIGQSAVTPGGRVVVGWIDPQDARVHVSEAAPGEPLRDGGVLGANATAHGLAVAAGEDGRAIVAWPQLASTTPVYRERVVAVMRPARGAPFSPAVAVGRPWRAVRPAAVRLLAHDGGLVLWTGSRFGAPGRRRPAWAATRLP